jgi:DNA-binding CsgD family transcriptional regulator
MTEAESTRAAGLPSVGAWDAAITAWRAAGDVYQVAYGQFRLAEAHAAQGDRTAATEPLAEAAAVARRLEARPLLADIESLASRARIDLGGAPAPPVGATSGHGLTAREVEVLRLVVEGRSNGEIAAGLYISAKTASVHVSNILRKLDVANRVEAAALAHRLRLLDA